jgi:hypothetical protein
MKTFGQQMADLGVELTAADVLTDEELAEYCREPRKKATDIAVGAPEDSEPPWL